MKLAEVKEILKTTKQIAFKLPNGSLVPAHFHVTEIGQISKNFIDCGGTIRNENVINFQLWNADDYDHRLHPEKLLNIIEIAEKQLHIGNFEIEVEYQGHTIEKYNLAFEENTFVLKAKQTDCLAKENCGIETPTKQKVNLKELQTVNNACCTPESGCC